MRNFFAYTARIRVPRFTLIEMLMVIAIISIIAAMLMPALQSSLSSARTAMCSSNMKQFYFATVNFTEDHDGYLPLAGYYTKSSGNEKVLFPAAGQLASPSLSWNWRVIRDGNCFASYIQPLRYAYCPAHPDADVFANPSLNTSWQAWNSYRVPSTQFNSYLPSSKNLAPLRKLSNRPFPSRLFMFLDFVNSTSASYAAYTGSVAGIGWYHNNSSGFTAQYFDGHGDFVPLSYEPVSKNLPPFEDGNF